jgi:hypothetical protein
LTKPIVDIQLLHQQHNGVNDMAQNIEQQLDASQARRMAAQDRFLARQEKRENAADERIGELMRNGKTVFYVFPVNGRYREAATRGDLVQFLISNEYA